MSGRVLLAWALAALAVAPACRAEAVNADRWRQIEALVQVYRQAGLLNSLVVGIVDERGPEVRGFGSMSTREGRQPDGDTVFEIGSATKAFNGMLLAEMVSRGEVGLNDPVQRYLPDGVKVPRFGNAEITLLHLVTHTAALPRDPTNVTPVDPLNPYADYAPEKLYALVAGCQLPRGPGTVHEYSNVGMALLGQALARRAGKTYEDLILERICRPLGLRSTRVILDAAMRGRLAPGHNADGDPMGLCDMTGMAPAGGIRSTANDMLRLVAANLGLLPSPLYEVLRQAQQPRIADEVALGWLLGGSGCVYHNGQTVAYHAFVGFMPAQKMGAVVLSDTAATQASDVANSVLQMLLGMPVSPPDLPAVPVVDPRILRSYAGEYELTPDFTIKVTVEDGRRLYAQGTGQQRLRVYPVAATVFTYKAVEAQILFQVDGTGKVAGLVLKQHGQDMPAKKVR